MDRGVDVRVSHAFLGVVWEQDKAYKENVLPSDVEKRLAVERRHLSDGISTLGLKEI